VTGGLGQAGCQSDGTADAAALLKQLLGQGLSVKEAAREAAAQTGSKKNELYALAIQIQENEPGES